MWPTDRRHARATASLRRQVWRISLRRSDLSGRGRSLANHSATRLARFSLGSRAESAASATGARVLEGSLKKMDPSNLWRTLTLLRSDNRSSGSVKMCAGLTVAQPSTAVKENMEWLDGLYRVRNCLAHRLGTAQMVDFKQVDVKQAGVPPDKTQNNSSCAHLYNRSRA